MKALALALAAALLAACSSVNSRIKKHQAEFDSYPPEIQQKIRAGQVDPGFTFDQVEMALGAPDRTYSETGPGARAREIWSYTGSAEPRVGFGVGYGSWHRGGIGTGVAVGGPGPYAYEDRITVIFEGGRAVNIRRRDR
jgi:hypothetical protein